MGGELAIGEDGVWFGEVGLTGTVTMCRHCNQVPWNKVDEGLEKNNTRELLFRSLYRAEQQMGHRRLEHGGGSNDAAV